MIVIILLIGISLTIAILFLGAFIWSLKSGQYDDMDSLIINHFSTSVHL